MAEGSVPNLDRSGDVSLALWVEPEQLGLITGIAQMLKEDWGSSGQARAEIVCVGTSAPGRSRELAVQLGAALGQPTIEPVDDLRSVLGHAKATAVLLATLGPLGAGVDASGEQVAQDLVMLEDCQERGVTVLSLEPFPSSVLQLGSPRIGSSADEPLVMLGPERLQQGTGRALGEGRREWARFVPLLRQSRLVRGTGELLEHFGRVQTCAIECWSGRGQGSLGARLFDALDSVVWLMGVPDRIDATYVGAARVRGLYALPGQSLRGLDGDLTANLRFPDGRAASVACSSRAGRFSRTLTLVGESGHLRIYDDGLLWTGPDGRVMEASRDTSRIRARSSEGGPGGVAQETRVADGSAELSRAIADQVLRALLQARAPGSPGAEPPSDLAGVLATAGAALLSARTGESESPMTLLRMARGG